MIPALIVSGAFAVGYAFGPVLLVLGDETARKARAWKHRNDPPPTNGSWISLADLITEATEDAR